MRHLHAQDGQFYTQAADVPANERIFATEIYLGIYDAPENWRLADEAEKEATEKEVEATEHQEREQLEQMED